MDKRERMNISISFTKDEKELFEYIDNKPNKSYYIKEILKEYMLKEEKTNPNIIQEIDTEDIRSMLF